jgi:hypothetical protein
VTTPTYLCASTTCTHRFTLPAPKVTGCPSCGSLYVTWTNHTAWNKAPGKSAAYQREYGKDGAR